LVAGRGEQSDDGQVFISYARVDARRIGPTVGGLRAAGLDVWIDTTSIAPSAEWWAEIRGAIERCDSAIVFLSAAYFRSTPCTDELRLMQEGGKKVVVVALETIPPDVTHEWRWLRDLNWIVPDFSHGVGDVVGRIAGAVAADLQWSAEHARLLVDAVEWERSGARRSKLLRGSDIAAAELALSGDRPPGQPQPTPLQRRFVAASRRSRGRLLGVVVGASAAVAILSTGLTVVAVSQREAARSALAEAEFRLLSSQSEAATSQSDAVRLAFQALDRASDARRTDAEAVVPLGRALGRSDIPLMHFTGLADDDGASGGRQGVDVSQDGSTLAYASTDGRVRIIDLWDVSERMRLDPLEGALTDYGAGFQVGLDPTGSQLVRIVVPHFPEGGSFPYEAALEVFDISGDDASRTSAATVEIASPAASIAFGPDEGSFVVAEDEGTITVVTLDGDEAQEVHLGTREPTSDAGFLSATISADGERVCSLGSQLQLYQVSPPRQLLEVANEGLPLSHGTPCIPERCADATENVMAVDDAGEVVCIGEGGARASETEYSFLADEPLISLRGISELGADGEPSGSWSVEQPTGVGVAPSYAHVRAPAEVVRPLELGFAVPGPTGPTIVGVGANGDIDLWSLAAGTLPPDIAVRGAEGLQHALGGQGVETGSPTLALGPADGEGSTLVDASSGAPVQPLRETSLPADGYEQSAWVLSDGDVLALAWTGEASVHPGDGATATTFDVDLVDEDLRDPAHDVGSDLLAFSTGSGIEVVDARSGEPVGPGASTDDDGYCAVDISQDGAQAAAVSCGSNGSAHLQTWEPAGSTAGESPIDLPFRWPNAVSISDDGRTVAVAFTFGEIAVRQGDSWIHPPGLTTTTADHNDYLRGWASVDPSGRWMVTRRDGRGMELWAIGEGSVSPIASISDEPRYSPPVGVEFTEDSLALTWSSDPLSQGIATSRWSLGQDGLRVAACQLVTVVTESGEPAEDPGSICDEPRGAAPAATTSTSRSDGAPGSEKEPDPVDGADGT
jgi:WD40 repeat protein